MTQQAWLAVLTPTAGGTAHTYVIDSAADSTTRLASLQYHHETVPTLKPQQDNSSVSSENSLNPDSGIRRSIESWHHGAAQTYFDRADSDPYRFRSSKGINPWTKWQLTALKDTELKLAVSSNYGHTLLKVNSSTTDYLYFNDPAGRTTKFTTSITAAGLASWTAVTGMGAAANRASMATDGSTIWIAVGSDIWQTTPGAAAATLYASAGGTIDVLAYAKGRLMATVGPSIYNVIAGGAFPAALFTHTNALWLWGSMTEGPNMIYAAGKIPDATENGSGSQVYRIGIKPDGTGLSAAIPATPGMPPDESVRRVGNYLGAILLGTTKGVRLCTADSNGDLTLGSAIQVATGIGVGAGLQYGVTECFTGSDRFVWFGVENYDGTATGLGRLDLSTFTDTLIPAAAPDLMVPTQGGIRSVTSFQGRRVFVVGTVGVYAESANYVSTGSLFSGPITYNLSDDKTLNKLTWTQRYSSLNTLAEFAVSYDDSAYSIITTTDGAGSGSSHAPTAGTPAERIELRTTLSTTDPSQSFILTRETLQVEAVVDSGNFIMLPLILAEETDDMSGTNVSMDVAAELTQIDTWRRGKIPLTLAVGDDSYNVVIRDYVWSPTNPESTARHNNGTVVLKLKES